MRASPWAAINKPMKPFIFDLPDELLRRIFEYVRGIIYEKDLYYIDFKSNSANSIREVRLTCRRFYETSSHLLLDYVQVRLTRQSLAQLDEISRHSFVSRGVRVIRLALVPFYDEVLAHDIRSFTAYHVSKFLGVVEMWETFQFFEHLAPPNLSNEVIEKAHRLARSWDEAAFEGVAQTDEDHALFARAHNQYGQRYKESKDLLDSLPQEIASAMMRMPVASWLVAEENSHSREYMEPFQPGDLESPGSLLEKLITPFGWEDAHDYELGPPPFNLSSALMLSIQQLGVTLQGLNLDTPPPTTGFSIAQTTQTSQEVSGLRAAVQHLKSIQFHPEDNISREFWAERPADEWNTPLDFLSNLLHTASLQRIHLNFSFMLHYDFQPSVSMAPLLLSCTWPALKILHFVGPFYLEELQSVVKRLDKNIELLWGGCLMSGSWVEVLELLKQHRWKSVLIGDVNGSTYGQECTEMEGWEHQDIFGDCRRNLATKYVQGLRKSNPVKDWEIGALEIQESEREDESEEEYESEGEEGSKGDDD